MGDLKCKLGLSPWMALVAVATVFLWSRLCIRTAAASSSSTAALADAAQRVAAPTCSASSVTLKNKNSYPIWIGENVTGGKIQKPPQRNWELTSGESIKLCLPADWTSGVFWARSECDFGGLYESAGPKGCGPFTTCKQKTDCTSLATGTGLTYDCVGGACMVDCTSQKTNAYCNGVIGPRGNEQAMCSNANSGSNYVCTYPEGVVCRSGDCDGLYQCQGKWDGNRIDVGPETPASLFEITDTSSADGGRGAATYDVSNAAGYNEPIKVSGPTPKPSVNPACYPIACSSDLNAGCPALLQIIEPPTSTPSSIRCGSEYCQSGACVTCPSGAEPSSCIGGKTCDIGCNAPGKLCANEYPLPVSAPGNTDLECQSEIPSGTADGVAFTADGSQYRDMYDAANDSGHVDRNDIGVTMFSGNQGTPTCWGDIDCAPGETCLLGAADTGITGLPSYVGICATPSQKHGALPSVQPVTDCASTADKGKNCGGYPKSPVYSCVAATGVNLKVACLPAFNPATVGLGTYDSISGFFTGIGAPLNPEWDAAALWASGNGATAGTTAYYKTFSQACPHQYAWTYDDHAGGLACNGYPLAFTVTFGKLKAEAPGH
jgi:hypothetical protein